MPQFSSLVISAALLLLGAGQGLADRFGISNERLTCESLLGPNGAHCDFDMTREQCDILDWARAGCERRSACFTRNNKKACCDGHNPLPYKSGDSYTVFMERCAPYLPAEKYGEPQHRELPCNRLFPSVECGLGMDPKLCNMRMWQGIACNQAAQCKDELNKTECCKTRDFVPKGADAEYSDAYMARCVKEASQKLSQ